MSPRPAGAAGETARQDLRARRTAGGWRASLPELIIAGVLMTAVTVAAYGWAGANGAAMVLACAAILALVLLRVLPDSDTRPEAQITEWDETSQTTIAGFWRRRGVVKNATLSMAAFETELRPTLQHLLAARLAERHGISLYSEPEAARSLLLSGGWDDKLWYWLDPQRSPRPDQRSGVPLRTLTAIIQRLEKL
jgi:hypothetical protein